MSTPEHGTGREAHQATIAAAGARARDGLRVSDCAAAVRMLNGRVEE